MVSDLKAYTTCSAVITRANKIAFKIIDGRLSLPAGYVDWSQGFPYCIVDKVLKENNLLFHPMRGNGIVQTRGVSGKWLTNISVSGPAISIAGEKNIRWLTLDEALKHDDEFRTPDTGPLIARLYQPEAFPLSFVHTTHNKDTMPRRSEMIHTSSWDPGNFIVTSTALRYGTFPNEPQYALMECGRKQFEGKLSLVGGGLGDSELLRRGTMRELLEEAGIVRGQYLGLAGVFVNFIGLDTQQNPLTVTNFASVFQAAEQQTNITRPDEVRGIKWYTVEDILSLQADQCRTSDTTRAILLADHAIRYGVKLISPSTIDYIETPD